jgi:apolipoprotein D and lipocalin family protein
MKFHNLLLSGALIMASSYHISAQKITPIKGFSLDKYLGTWYEIARMPFSYEKNLSKVTATYGLRDDGKVSVVNRGVKPNGKESVARGKAKFAGPQNVGHLKVSFFLWFYADYIIVDLDSAYQYAMVASSPPKYLWILSRKPQLDSSVVTRLVNSARTLGYDTDELIMTTQTQP